MTFEQAGRFMKEHPDFTLLDVREEEEYLMEHADGAILFPLDLINRKSAAELLPDQDKPILLYCRTGRRSAEAASLLEQLGYTQLYDLGGLSGWPYGISYGSY
jgi:rhodanese-related sulfurtransferase